MSVVFGPFCRASAVIAALLVGVACCRAVADPEEYLTIAPIRAAGSAEDERGYARSKINAVSIKQQSLTTVTTPQGEKYQFVSYYDDRQKLVVGRRKMLPGGWSDWHLRRTAFTSNNINDNHDVSSIGVDGDGVLHVSWGMHGNPLLYTRSAAPALGDDPLMLIGDTVGNEGGLRAEFAPANQRVTYPLFYNVPGSGDLLFAFRIGNAGNGNWQLFRWNNARDAWKPVHAFPETPWISADDPDDDLPSVNAYTNYAAFDRQGRWHLTWSWRTGGDSLSPFKDYQTNHNLMYAWSPNQGVDWYRQDGTPYRRDGKHAIDEANAPPVVTLAEGNSLINQAYMAVGPDGKVYVATWWAPRAAQGDHLRQYMLAWQDGDAWKTSQITQRQPENVDGNGVSQRVPETQLKNYRITRPIVAVDDSDRVIVLFTDWQRGGKLTVAHSEDPRRNDWRLFDLPTENMGTWEASLDLNRWQRDGVISLLYQPTQLGGAATVVSVLEWDARSYFAAAADGARSP